MTQPDIKRYNDDGVIDIQVIDTQDAILVLSAYANSNKYDINGDDIVDANDLSIAMSFLLHSIGPSSPPLAKRSDVNGNGVIDIQDFFLIMANYT